ncbi:hypothetical protein [Ancylobacter sp. TS-1]|uniref:hypothetical protein n=1 Tax=Ancylobacter sp. TS-1 TaxID=1850374 RepID=UPI001265C339|nr:hypothetical protein [Ancylobacter sp. TS-1]QFR32389.1 hypothetical protein GBB76_04250 [Ancylobacter sp. TS-1]
MAPRTKKAGAAAVAPTNAPETNSPEGAPGTAREAPSAGSGDGALQAPSGTQSAPPHVIPAPQQPEQSSGEKAEPEPIEGAPASDSAALGQAAPAPETGEATGSGAPAGAAPDADLRTDAGDGVEKTPVTMPGDGGEQELVAEFDPAVFVAGLSEGQRLRLAAYLLDDALPVVPPGTALHLKEEQRYSFDVTSVVHLDGRPYAPGSLISLTRRQHAELKAAHAVDGDWPD